MISGLIARRAWPWVLAAGAVAVAGCSGGSVPAASTPSALPRSGPAAVSASPSTSASPSAGRAPEPPVLPAAARKPTQAGAEAFFRYFWAVYDYSFRSGRTDAIGLISAKECGYCAAVVKNVRTLRDKGYVITGGTLDVEVVVASAGQPSDGLLIYSRISQEPGEARDRSGALVKRESGFVGNQTEAVVRWTDRRWVMVGVKVTKKGDK